MATEFAFPDSAAKAAGAEQDFAPEKMSLSMGPSHPSTHGVLRLQMELDGELVPVKPMTAIFIKPGCRHRAVGNLRIVNIPVPAFDPHDEWFD